jgi:hypothetical protein
MTILLPNVWTDAFKLLTIYGIYMINNWENLAEYQTKIWAVDLQNTASANLINKTLVLVVVILVVVAAVVRY